MALRRTIKHYNKAPSRRLHTTSPKTANMRPLQPPAIPTFGAIAVANITVTFNEPVTLTGIPAWTAQGGRTILSIAQTSPTVFVLTWSATLVGQSPIVIPFQDPAFRTYQGGYVQPGSFPIA
jgi:hypothetical protein